MNSGLACAQLTLRVPDRTLCSGLSFTVQPGEVWAVLGPNGSGKSTLLHALAGVTRPAKGEVALGGALLADLDDGARARGVGLLLQNEDSEFWGTVLDYVLLGRYAHAPRGLAWRRWQHDDDTAAHAALERVGLTAYAMRRFMTLSGGERQRVRIAQLLTQAPAYFLLDEPLLHLDLKHQVQTLKLFSELARDRAHGVVMVLHDALWPARCCTHALLMHGDGRASVGCARDMLTRDRLEALYDCTLAAAGAEDAVRGFFPAL